MKVTSRIFLLLTLMLSSQFLYAKETATYNIPIIEQARIFAQFTDKLPAVVNYFSDESEEAIIHFYQGVYGEALLQERKRGRLILIYNNEDNKVRVIISQQNKTRQVDILVSQK